MGAFTYFISDLHLSAERQDITDCLMTFLREEAPKADALYVLGDLFEVWIGDDDINPFTQLIAQAFKQLSLTTPGEPSIDKGPWKPTTRGARCVLSQVSTPASEDGPITRFNGSLEWTGPHSKSAPPRVPPTSCLVLSSSSSLRLRGTR